MATTRETFKVYFTAEEALVVRDAAGEEAVSGYIRRTVLNNARPKLTGVDDGKPRRQTNYGTVGGGESDGDGGDQNVQRVRDVPADRRGADPVGRVEGSAVPRPSAEADDAVGAGSAERFRRAQIEPKNFSDIAVEVARRTGHSVGCECFHCLQTHRFLNPPAPKKKEEKKPTKKGRR